MLLPIDARSEADLPYEDCHPHCFQGRICVCFRLFDMAEKDSKIRRPFLGMHFKCCNVYSRIYLNKREDAFVGWCPKCAGPVKVNVSPQGTEGRFFTAG
ncbi:MAG TPA: hypothetical protein VN285_06505 [Candidatus Deferrimicrobium sp.]|nr:hypothetical protein [Candidatus Deferrimicrobium sp.]